MTPTRSKLEQNLSMLVCPVCHGALRLEVQEIACEGCGRRYPIVDELPVLIGGRATLSQGQH